MYKKFYSIISNPKWNVTTIFCYVANLIRAHSSKHNCSDFYRCASLLIFVSYTGWIIYLFNTNLLPYWNIRYFGPFYKRIQIWLISIKKSYWIILYLIIQHYLLTVLLTRKVIIIIKYKLQLNDILELFCFISSWIAYLGTAH